MTLVSGVKSIVIMKGKEKVEVVKIENCGMSVLCLIIKLRAHPVRKQNRQALACSALLSLDAN